ncbi:hypothetical protein T02_11671 [Trichinella nativa]|uniref:Uncharacterized protein n=1 Tax=Trichinella nativa TaxID=6335 RepID=A0A0V1LDC7_9BILA|nr:hypothetical protein T02_11671 [Trichinella nativa]
MESTNVSYDDFYRAFWIFVVVIVLVAAVCMLLACSIVRRMKRLNGKGEATVNGNALCEYWFLTEHSNSMVSSAGFVHYVPSDASMFTSEYQTRFSSATTGVGVNIEVDGEFLE